MIGIAYCGLLLLCLLLGSIPFLIDRVNNKLILTQRVRAEIERETLGALNSDDRAWLRDMGWADPQITKPTAANARYLNDLRARNDH